MLLACPRGISSLNVNTRASYIYLNIEQRRCVVLACPHGTSSFAMAVILLVCLSTKNGNPHTLDVARYS